MTIEDPNDKVRPITYTVKKDGTLEWSKMPSDKNDLGTNWQNLALD